MTGQSASLIDALALVGVGSASILLLLLLPAGVLFGLARMEQWAVRKSEREAG